MSGNKFSYFLYLLKRKEMNILISHIHDESIRGVVKIEKYYQKAFSRQKSIICNIQINLFHNIIKIYCYKCEVKRSESIHI